MRPCRRKIYELLEATAVDIYYRKALMGESIKEFGYLGKSYGERPLPCVSSLYTLHWGITTYSERIYMGLLGYAQKAFQLTYTPGTNTTLVLLTMVSYSCNDLVLCLCPSLWKVHDCRYSKKVLMY